jgi:cobalt-zinc-cadmium efflux system membrane fusion protein
MSDATVLLVDDDTVLSQVLQRVLTRQGYKVVEAGSVADALRAAAEHQPNLALIDLCLPDGDGVDLARQLEKAVGPLPLILMTAYPLRLRDQPELAKGFANILTKPLNLEELRQTMEKALAGIPTPNSSTVAIPSPATPPAAPQAEPALRAPDPTPARSGKILIWGVPIAATIVAAVLFLGLPALGMPSFTEWFKPKSTSAAVQAESASSSARLVADDPNGIDLLSDVAERLVGKTEAVKEAATPRPLVLSGSLSFDINLLFRVQSRFGGEVVRLGNTLEPGSSETGGETRERPLRYGDRVRKGDLLAVVLSKDLGEKKSELVDSLVKLHVDQLALERYEAMAKRGVLPEAQLLAQRAVVATDRNAVARAERTLLTWKVDREEIAGVKAEALRVQDDLNLRDLAKEATTWSRVDIVAPHEGIIVEKNVTIGNIVDTTLDLYKIADLKELGVVVHAYEEDLKAIRQLNLPYPWDVRVPADPRRGPLKSYGLEQIGRVVDPSQHTAPVMGRVDNRRHDLEVGQFVTATVLLPAPRDVVSLPAQALDEDGESSIVFVQPDPTRPVYTRRRVVVTQRLGDVIYVRSVLSEEERSRGLQPIHPGEHVVVRSVVELKATLEGLQAEKHK